MPSHSPVGATPDSSSTGAATGSRTGKSDAVRSALALHQLDAAEVADRLHDGIAQSLTGLQLLLGNLGDVIAEIPGVDDLLARAEEGLVGARRELREARQRLLLPTRHPTLPALAIRADLSAGQHRLAPSPTAVDDVRASAEATDLARLAVHHAVRALPGAPHVVTVARDGGWLRVEVRSGADAPDPAAAPRLQALTAVLAAAGGSSVQRSTDDGCALQFMIPTGEEAPADG